jgi:DNA-binding response OmpR family regulator
MSKTPVLAGMSMLVLEDEFFIAMALEETLIEAGAETVIVAKSLDEVESLPDQNFGAAILDIRVVDGTSFELATELLGHGVAVTFHSGHTSQSDVQHFPEAEFCPKPALPKEVVNSVVRSIERLQRSHQASVANQ